MMECCSSDAHPTHAITHTHTHTYARVCMYLTVALQSLDTDVCVGPMTFPFCGGGLEFERFSSLESIISMITIGASLSLSHSHRFTPPALFFLFCENRECRFVYEHALFSKTFSLLPLRLSLCLLRAMIHRLALYNRARGLRLLCEKLPLSDFHISSWLLLLTSLLTPPSALLR